MNDERKRIDGRSDGELRPVTVETGVNIHAEGSALITVGNTKVLCCASVEEKVPSWMYGKGLGWVTAEYSMLPRSTHTRMRRERTGAGGRTLEIQRLVARSLRGVVDRALLGERSITVDCDVLQADGGTRCASITGAYVALHQAITRLMEDERIARNPLVTQVAAVSVGIVEGRPLLDLCYEEDSSAEVDMNVVMTGDGRLVEVQGTAEEHPFPRTVMNAMLDLAETGITRLCGLQRETTA